MNLEQLVSINLFQFFMVFARLGSAIMLLPGFGEAYVPPRIRLIFALTVSFALMPMIAEQPARHAGRHRANSRPCCWWRSASACSSA